MALPSSARAVCAATALPSPISSRGASRRGVARIQHPVEPLQPAVQRLRAAVGVATAPADAASRQSLPETHPSSSSSSLVPAHTQTAWRPLRVRRLQQQFYQQQPWAPATATAVLVPGSLTLDVRQLDVHLNEPPSLSPQTPPPQQDDEEKDFFANVGDAIRTLREDYPLLFVKDLNYAIYRQDLVFQDPNLTFQGLKNYKIIFWSLRFHSRLFLKAAHVQILRIWQPEDRVIKLRWQINATPRVGSPGTFDGISVYRLDRRGRVRQHEITDVQMRDPPITNPLLYGLNFLLSPRPQVQQVPCPGSYFVEGEEDMMPDMLINAPVLLTGSGQE